MLLCCTELGCCLTLDALLTDMHTLRLHSFSTQQSISSYRTESRFSFLDDSSVPVAARAMSTSSYRTAVQQQIL